MIDFSDLDHDPKLDSGKPVGKAKAKDRPTFPCQSCDGTGIYKGVRIHQMESKCFACGGKGFFYTSPSDRLKRKAEAADKKRRIWKAAADAFNELHPGFLDLLNKACEFSTFAQTMREQYNEKGNLTAGQVEAVERLMAKAAATKAAKLAERDKHKATVDLSPIHQMFDHASKAGLKRLQYRAESLVISPAKAHSVNAGALYVKTESGTYLGKIVGDKFSPSRDATANTTGSLLKIAEDPIEVAKAYGKLTGRCSCCGRELTDPTSIELGIGPVCVEKWFGVATPGPTKAEVKEAMKKAEVQINTNYSKAVKTSATKYEYPEGLTDAQKKAFRAKMRRTK